jgi:hypothetical protein
MPTGICVHAHWCSCLCLLVFVPMPTGVCAHCQQLITMMLDKVTQGVT